MNANTKTIEITAPPKMIYPSANEFPMSLVYLYLGGILIMCICVLILLERIKGKKTTKQKRIQRTPKDSKRRQKKKRKS